MLPCTSDELLMVSNPCSHSSMFLDICEGGDGLRGLGAGADGSVGQGLNGLADPVGQVAVAPHHLLMLMLLVF